MQEQPEKIGHVATAREPVGYERVLEVLDVIFALSARAIDDIVDELRVKVVECRNHKSRMGSLGVMLGFNHDVARAGPGLCGIADLAQVTDMALLLFESTLGLIGRGGRCFEQPRVLGNTDDVFDITPLIIQLLERCS